MKFIHLRKKVKWITCKMRILRQLSIFLNLLLFFGKWQRKKRNTMFFRCNDEFINERVKCDRKQCVKCHTKIKSNIYLFHFLFRSSSFFLKNSADPSNVSALMRNFWSSNTFSLELNYSELFWLQQFSKTNDALWQATHFGQYFLFCFPVSKLKVCVWNNDLK